MRNHFWVLRAVLCLLMWSPTTLAAQDTLQANQHFVTAMGAYEAGDFVKAGDLFRQAGDEFRQHAAHRRAIDALLYEGEARLKLGQKPGTRRAWLTADSLWQLHARQDRGLRAQIANNLGVLAFYEGRVPEIVPLLEEARHIWDSLGNADPESMCSLLSNLGIAQSALGNLEASLEPLLEAEQVALDDSANQLVNLAIICGNVGHVLGELGDAERSLVYLRRAQRYGLSVMDSLDPQMGSVYNNLAAASIMIGDTATFEQASRSSLAIIRRLFPPGHPRYLFWQSNYANGKMGMGLERQAAVAFDSLEALMLRTDPAQIRGFIYGSFIDHCFQMGQPERFAPFWEGYRQQALGFDGRALVLRTKYHADLARHLLQEGKLEAARAAIQQAAIVGSRSFDDPDFREMPTVDEVLPFVGFGEVCYRKAQIAIATWKQTGNTGMLDLALKWLEMAMDLDIRQRATQPYYVREPALKGLRQRVHALAVQVAYDLYAGDGDQRWLERAYLAMERGKAIRLQDALNDHRATSFAGVPDSLVVELKSLRKALLQQRNALKAAYREGTPEQIAQAEERQAELLRQQELLGQELEAVAPAYYELKFLPNLVPPQEVLDQLKQEGRGMVMYFQGPEKMYGLGAFEGKFYPFEVELSALNQEVHRYQSSISRPDFLLNRSQNYQDFAQSAHRLYQLLVAPVRKATGGKPMDRMLVVPDGILLDVSFSAFLTRPAPAAYSDFGGLAYLVRETHISRAYTLSVQERVRPASADAPGKPGVPLLFAPSFRDRPLPGAQEEVLQAGQLIGGERLEGASATESAFYAHGVHSRLLHFATHGKTDHQHPMDAHLELVAGEGQDGKLHAYEVLGLDLKADLVVLSACESGVGHEAAGQGRMSLVRAFRYAGCPSAVMSMWAVPDEAARQVVAGFYEGLVKGLDKDVALGMAKREYLESAKDEMAHPFYWASLELIGDTAPLDGLGGTSWGIWILLAALGALGLYVWREWA